MVVANGNDRMKQQIHLRAWVRKCQERDEAHLFIVLATAKVQNKIEKCKLHGQ
jgi:hypothetical protein